MNKNIFITGGAGYIGSHAVKLFLEKNYKVTVFDNLSRGYRESLKILGKFGELKFIKGDLRNKKDITSALNTHYDCILHFAALCLVNESMEKPELYFENNVLGSLNLFQAMKQSGNRNIIFSSTCAVYGEPKYLPVDIDHPTNPINPYGESKLMVEKILKWYGEIHKFNYIIFRYFNVCGANKDGIIGDSKKPSQLLVQNAVRGALGIEKFYLTCPKVKTPDTTPIRDYIDVEDLVEAHYLGYKYLIKNKGNKILNLGNGKGYSVLEIVRAVEKILKVKIKAERTSPRKGEYAKIYADPSLAQKILRWRTKKSLKDSIESLKKWYEKFPRGYKY